MTKFSSAVRFLVVSALMMQVSHVSAQELVSNAQALVTGSAAEAATARCEAQAAAVHSVWWPQVQNAVEHGAVEEARVATCNDESRYTVLIDCLNQFYQSFPPAAWARIEMQTRLYLTARGMTPPCN